jgi:hypothetical protein
MGTHPEATPVAWNTRLEAARTGSQDGCHQRGGTLPSGPVLAGILPPDYASAGASGGLGAAGFWPGGGITTSGTG